MKKRYIAAMVLGFIGVVFDAIDIYSFIDDFRTLTITGQPPIPDFQSVVTWAALRWAIIALVSGGLFRWGFKNRHN
jgi:hypothetical protein